MEIDRDERGAAEAAQGDEVLNALDGQNKVDNDIDKVPLPSLKDRFDKGIAEDFQSKDALDGQDQADRGVHKEPITPPNHRFDNEIAQDSQSDEDDEVQDDKVQDEQEEIALSASDTEEPSPEALDKLQTFISTLDPTSKRKISDVAHPDDHEAQRKRRRVGVKERTEGGAENEFGAHAAGASVHPTGYNTTLI
jgi:hypothetical protein